MRRLVRPLIVLLLACSATQPSDDWQEQLDDARDRWEQRGPSSYAYRYTRHCFCPQLNLRVTVQDDVVTAIRDLTADTAYAAPYTDFTIPVLFDQVQEFIDQQVDALTVSYDPVIGIPLSVAADPIANAVDDEQGFTITEFALTP